MSYHYPHHVGKISPEVPSNSDGVANRQPQMTGGGAGNILTFARAGGQPDAPPMTGPLRPRSGTFMEDRTARPSVNWSEGAAMAGGLLVLLITAWLIWAALAEAVIAAAHAA